MKSLKNLTLAFVAFTVLATSCVENEVSPQVEAIRTQQVEWLKAKAVLENANADFQKIKNIYQKASDSLKILNETFASRTAEFNSKQQELLYLAAVENNKTTLKAAEVALKAQELNLTNQLASLKKATDEQGSTEAATYFGNYKTQAGIYTGLLTNKISKENAIATANLALVTDINVWNIQKKGIQATIDASNATLTAQNANLVTLQSISANPTSLQTEKANLEKANTELTSQINKLNTDRVIAVNNKTEKSAIVTAANTAITTMAGYKNSLKTNATNLVNNATDITTAQTTLTTVQLDLSNAKSELAAKTIVYDNAKTNYTSKDTDYQNKLALRNAKQFDFDKASAAYDIALANWTLKPTDATLTLIKDNTLAAKNSAQTALTTANTDLNTASTARNSAQALLTPAENNFTTIKNSVANLETQVFTAETTLKSKNDKKTELTLEKARLDSLVAALQTEFNTADANIYKYTIDVQVAQDAIDAIDKQITAANATKTQNSLVITSLTSNISGISTIQASIETLKTAINTTETSIANNTKSLNTFTDSKKYAEAQITVLTAELAVINTQIAEVEKLVAYWKGLLDGILK